MDLTNHLDSLLETYTELAEEKQTLRSTSVTALPSLASLLADANTFPQEALYLGLAEDSLPVLLNLFDPAPGPLLVAGDEKIGKTALLQMIARAIELLHAPSNVQFCVITNHAEEWKMFDESKHNAGIYPIQHEMTSGLLESLVTWAHTNRGEQQSIVLLVDDLYEVTKLSGLTEQNLRWLFLRGPSRRVWPVITLNSNYAEDLHEWLTFFRTRIFGQVTDAQTAQAVTGNSHFKLGELIPNAQFAMKENNSLLKFWVPLID